MAKVCPCKVCVAPKRQPGCHGFCKDYLEWNAEHQQELAKIRKEKMENGVSYPTYQQRCKQLKKGMRWKKYGSNTTD